MLEEVEQTTEANHGEMSETDRLSAFGHAPAEVG